MTAERTKNAKEIAERLREVEQHYRRLSPLAHTSDTAALAAGDWIVRGVKGEMYPCKPDIFAATYEPIASIDGGGK